MGMCKWSADVFVPSPKIGFPLGYSSENFTNNLWFVHIYWTPTPKCQESKIMLSELTFLDKLIVPI